METKKIDWPDFNLDEPLQIETKKKEILKTAGGAELTPHEISCVKSLRRLAKKWNKHTNRLWLFSASSNLTVMMFPGNGNYEDEFDPDGCINKNNAVEVIDIPNDGGDW